MHTRPASTIHQKSMKKAWLFSFYIYVSKLNDWKHRGNMGNCWPGWSISLVITFINIWLILQYQPSSVWVMNVLTYGTTDDGYFISRFHNFMKTGDNYSVSQEPKSGPSVPKGGSKLDSNIFIHYVPEYLFPSTGWSSLQKKHDWN